jgi:hypothetical protein
MHPRFVALLPWLAVGLAASLPYVSSAGNYFVNDDFGVVQLLSRKEAFYFPRWFVTPWTDSIWGATADEIRPFTAVSYQLAAVGGAASPLLNHVINIVFHVATALLVLGVARLAAGAGPIAATFAAVVFAVLPLHAESVIWITGRVDTIPAFFFLASFLAYVGWRRSDSRANGLYVSSLVLFFCALFSKQNTIVMVATLAMYDRLVQRRPLGVSWPWLRPYVPFAILTIAYLLLRYALFGEAAREGQLTADGLGLSRIFVGKHLQRMFFGGEIGRYPLGYIAALVIPAAVWLLLRIVAASRHGAAGVVCYFGPCWWFLCLLPLVVVGYESTRHVYLASVGWGVLLGLAFDALWQRRHAALRYAVIGASAGLLVFYVSKLQTEVTDWKVRSAVSAKIVADLEREAMSMPEGSLIIVGAPSRSWEWALPFAAQPPFTRIDLTNSISIIWPILLDCCRLPWPANTRQTIQAWSERRTPIVALRWDARTGAYGRLTDRDEPALRDQVVALLSNETTESMDGAMLTLLESVPLRLQP